MPALPFAPEPLAALRRRYHRALTPAFDVARIVADPSAPRPGLERRCVFDFEDGTRLIVSRDDHGDGKPAVIYVSASIEDGLRPHAEIARTLRRVAAAGGVAAAMEHFRAHVEGLFRELSGDARPMTFLGWSEEEGVPHWHLDTGGDAPHAH